MDKFLKTRSYVEFNCIAIVLLGFTIAISACNKNSTLSNDSQTSIPNVVQDIQPNSFEDEKKF